MTDERPVEFPKGEPEYWFAEFDVEAKVLEIGIDETTIRIPQETVLSWMMIGEKIPSKGTWDPQRNRNKNGRWRKKRSDAGKPRKKRKK